jgi:hypothetical protein
VVAAAIPPSPIRSFKLRAIITIRDASPLFTGLKKTFIEN